jgi:hypothetical protein
MTTIFVDILRQQRFEERVNRLAGDLLNNNINDAELVDIAGVGGGNNVEGGNDDHGHVNQAAGGDNQQVNGQDDQQDGPYLFAIRSAFQLLALYCGVVVSHPFHVIAIRSYAQFVGRETKYKYAILKTEVPVSPANLYKLFTYWQFNLRKYRGDLQK